MKTEVSTAIHAFMPGGNVLCRRGSTSSPRARNLERVRRRLLDDAQPIAVVTAGRAHDLAGFVRTRSGVADVL